MSAGSTDQNVRHAPPILASTLLELESDHKKTGGDVEPFQTGIKRLDANLPQTLWTGGKITGIVSDRGESKVRIYSSFFGTNVRLNLLVHQLAEYLITSHLAALASSIPQGDHRILSTFVICTPNTSIASNVHGLLQSRVAARPRSACLKLLDTVQIMQYFDIAGLTESISEVSSCLHDLKSGPGANSSRLKRHILVVDGLCPALESTQRRSGLVQANALAASLLRSLTHLSRSNPSLLILIDLEASREARSEEELTSAFSSPERSIRGIRPGGVLQKTLLAGIDTVILLHDKVDTGLKDGDLIVEVARDREGASLGHWVVWPGSA